MHLRKFACQRQKIQDSLALHKVSHTDHHLVGVSDAIALPKYHAPRRAGCKKLCVNAVRQNLYRWMQTVAM